MKKILCAILLCSILFSCTANPTDPSVTTEKSGDPVALLPIKKSGVTVENGYAVGIPAIPTADELCAMFDGDITVSANGVAIAGDKPVPAGAVISNGSTEAIAVIYGDLSRDGKIDDADISAIAKLISDSSDDTLAKLCADVDMDGKIGTADSEMIQKKIDGERVWLGMVGLTVTEDAQIAASEDSSLTLAFGNGIDRYLPDTDIGNAATDVMYCAKGEIEFTQFALKSVNGHEGLSVSITKFKNAKGEELRTELYVADFIQITDNGASIRNISDVMSPVLDGIKIKAGNIRPFGIKAYPAADSSYGLYEATVTVKDADGNEIKKALVFLNVWDFVLPETSYCRTSFGLFKNTIGSSKTASVEERYKTYYEFFIENRLNPSLLPYDICDERAEEYMNDPRVNSFLAGGEGYGGAYDTTDKQLEDRYALLSQNEEWMKKAYFYYDDEPLNFENAGKPSVADQISSIKANYKHVRELFPGAKIVIPNHYNAIDERFGGDIVGFVMDHSSILCPHLWMFTDPAKATENVWYTQEMIDTYGTLKSRIDSKLENDPEAEYWWYTSDNPRDGMCNFYITKSGIECRTVFWQQYLYGANGFLYWDASDFNSVNGTNKAVRNEYAGLLCYNNIAYRIEDPVGSVRLELVRDGIEDFDYLHMIEEKFGKDVADVFVARITTDLMEYNTDSAVLEQVRIEMGELLQGWSDSDK